MLCLSSTLGTGDAQLPVVCGVPRACWTGAILFHGHIKLYSWNGMQKKLQGGNNIS